MSTAQAESAGMTRHVIARCLADGNLSPVVRGIYAVDSAPPTFEGLAWAGCLVAGEGSKVGGAAAAHLSRLSDAVPDTLDVVVSGGRSVRRDDARWRFVREQGGVLRAAGPGLPPRLSVEDTVLDLCESCSEPEVVGWVSAAVQRRLTTPERLQRRMTGRPRVRHRALIAKLLKDVAVGAESPLEVAYLNGVERAHDLPRGVRQLNPGSGYRTDVDYDPYPLLVELDGRLGHEEMGRFRDMDRDNVHVVLGRATLRYGHADVFTRPCAVAWQVADVLVRCGWGGLMTRCPRCVRLDLRAS